MTATNDRSPVSPLNLGSSNPPAQPAPRPMRQPKFEHPLMVRQSSRWSHWILWTLMASSVGAVVWANVAQIDESIPAIGKLEPVGTVKDVQVPLNGVVKQVHVKEGQRVQKGDILVSLDPTTSQAQITSLKTVKTTLEQENEFYRSQLNGESADPSVPVPAPILNLTKSRATLMAERHLLQAQLEGSDGVGLTATQRERLQSNQVELMTREAAGKLKGQQLEQQLEQTQVKLAAAEETLAANQRLLDNVAPIAEDGAISQVQLIKQQQEVSANQSEVLQLRKELDRLQLAIAESETQVATMGAQDRKDLTRQISETEQRIADIDSQLSKAIVENNKRVAEVDSQLSQAQQALTYGEVKAPVDGVVFELKASGPGFVANSTEPILKIVPEEALIAKVAITNQDIGFVKEGMNVDVRIDSFPFSEFGDVKGDLTWIGSDALPPTQIQPMYTFPAKIRLSQQVLKASGREIRLQSGMSLSANIKVRKRTVMSIFTDQFTKATEGFNHVR